MKKISELCSNIKIIEIIGNDSPEITNIQYDSRKCTNGTLFVALRGSQSDGHNFISKAIENGAVAVICDEIPFNIENTTFIRVQDTRSALSSISHNWFDNPSRNMRVIGVTGTNGKTTITYLMKSIFESFGETAGIIGTTGIFYGDSSIEATHTTPESLELAEIFAKMRDAGVKNVIMEVSSHALSQHRADNINFHSALFTNLTHDHLDYHSTMEDYAEAKKKLFDMLDDNGLALIFDNSSFSDFMIRDTKARSKYFIGRTEKSNFRIDNEKLDLHFSSYNIISDQIIQLKTKLTGRFNIDNSAMAFVWFMLNGYNREELISYLPEAEGAPGRMQRISLKNGAIALVDYAHTPDALEKALLSCREILNTSGNSENMLISVFGCGGDRDKTKRPEMGKISSAKADISIITSDNPRTENPDQILNDIMDGISTGLTNIYKIPDRREAINKSFELSSDGDIILVAGKGHENYQIIGKEKFHFDDTEELIRFSGN